ncbi:MULTISPECIES: DUF2635 domain-containing protein [unclassified Pseudomonas]|uniref:DUF2635 domain-containing protein n=1 Tax=unclassified Pseudomonas TaxID=196821 RepID=UPI0015A3350E|nr:MULTISPECIES: DUF2635 domain-containing protein [unclassified Pseudomonas]NWC92623.1 DUF2635 domain-containing protein [Pseudomonas sp. IPO3779]NWD15620.1 DUF2635 domain-containing protein [Pseudomonas sp. IPO3778]
MRIYPFPGLLVRDPVKRDALPEEGREVADNDLYWLRRLRCNDVTLTPPKPVPVVEVKPPAVKGDKPDTPEPPKGSDS